MNQDDDKKEPPVEAANDEDAAETPEEIAAAEHDAAMADQADYEDDEADDQPDDPATGDEPPTYEELQSDVAALKDQLLRALAETENVRRRAERDKADMSKYAVSNFAREVLGVADNLRRAMDTVGDAALEANDDLKNLYVGIEMTEKALEASYEQFGIKPVDAVGKKFDHNFHQAMFEVEDPDQPSGMVVQEMQRGYMIHDRLLRPAMVGVSKGGPKPADVPAEGPSDDGASSETKPKGSSAAYEKLADVGEKDGDESVPAVDKEL